MNRLAPILLLFISSSYAHAATINVPADQPTVQDAVNAAAPGDTVLETCDNETLGTYYEHDILITTSVVIWGVGNCAVIDAQGLGRVFECNVPGGVVQFERLRFENGVADSGGGMYIHPGTTVNIRNGWFRYDAAHYGAAIFANNAEVEVRLSDLEENTSLASNSIGGTAIGAVGSDVQIHGIFVRDNIGGLSGGGFLFDSCEVSIIDSHFHRNTAYNGSAISAVQSTLLINGCSFYDNTLNGLGAAIHLTDSSCEIGQTPIAQSGGAIYSSGGSLEVRSCTMNGQQHFERWRAGAVSAPHDFPRRGGATVGIQVDSSPAVLEVRSSLISEFGVGVECGSNADVTLSGSAETANDIHTNEVFNVVRLGTEPINATYNYWGTLDFPTIESMFLGPVVACPIVDSTHTEAPCAPVAVGELPPTHGAKALTVWPNPSPGPVAIRFDMPALGPAELAIYDARGRRLRTLSSARLAPGPYEVSWDGRDAAGAPVASGIYFIRLENGLATRTTKVTVLRR